MLDKCWNMAANALSADTDGIVPTIQNIIVDKIITMIPSYFWGEIRIDLRRDREPRYQSQSHF